MKKNELNDLKNKKIEELHTDLKKQIADLSKAAIEVNLGKNKNKHSLNKIKKNIAQIKTIIRQKTI